MPDEIEEGVVDSVKIIGKMLKGLKFSGSERKEVKTDAGTKIKYFPFERDLKPDDLLDAKDNGNGTAMIVTKDGKKYTVDMGK